MWITDRLPEENKYVLVRLNKTNWIDNDDPENVYCVVAKLVKGISKQEREDMKNGKIPCEMVRYNYDETPRYRIYKSCDEDGNNHVPYNWEPFGPGNFFGQEVMAWMPIEPFNLENTLKH